MDDISGRKKALPALLICKGETPIPNVLPSTRSQTVDQLP